MPTTLPLTFNLWSNELKDGFHLSQSQVGTIAASLILGYNTQFLSGAVVDKCNTQIASVICLLLGSIPLAIMGIISWQAATINMASYDDIIKNMTSQYHQVNMTSRYNGISDDAISFKGFIQFLLSFTSSKTEDQIRRELRSQIDINETVLEIEHDPNGCFIPFVILIFIAGLGAGMVLLLVISVNCENFPKHRGLVSQFGNLTWVPYLLLLFLYYIGARLSIILLTLLLVHTLPCILSVVFFRKERNRMDKVAMVNICDSTKCGEAMSEASSESSYIMKDKKMENVTAYVTDNINNENEDPSQGEKENIECKRSQTLSETATKNSNTPSSEEQTNKQTDKVDASISNEDMLDKIKTMEVLQLFYTLDIWLWLATVVLLFCVEWTVYFNVAVYLRSLHLDDMLRFVAGFGVVFAVFVIAILGMVSDRLIQHVDRILYLFGLLVTQALILPGLIFF